MSDFFGGLQSGNMRFTDARIDGDGPLPTSLSGPEGINGDPDGRYNFNESLLSGIIPYAFGKEGRMGSDRNYQQIPHRKQFPVPPVFLPEPDPGTDQTFEMSHGIDMGDIAFILNVHHKRFLLCPPPHSFASQDEDHTMPNWNVFCNICTVNYLLAGLHNHVVHTCIRNAGNAGNAANPANANNAWGRLLRCFGVEQRSHYIVQQYRTESAHNFDAPPDQKTEIASRAHALMTLRCQMLLQDIVRRKIIPIGICAMSEKQGGQHEVGLKPVQAAASFYTTLTVDGQNRDLVNIWRSIDISAGDFLILRLDFLHRGEKNPNTKRVYMLNHYYKDTVTKTLLMDAQTKGTLQLVPDVFSVGYTRKKDKYYEGLLLALPNSTVAECALDYRQQGYWHIGQTYTKKQCFSDSLAPTNDGEMMQGQLLQINFAPVWKGNTEALCHGSGISLKNYKFLLLYILQKIAFEDSNFCHSVLHIPERSSIWSSMHSSIHSSGTSHSTAPTSENDNGDIENMEGIISGTITKEVRDSGVVQGVIEKPSTGVASASIVKKHRKKGPSQTPHVVDQNTHSSQRSNSSQPSEILEPQATAISDFEKELEKMYNDFDGNSKQPQVTGIEVTDGAAGEAKAKKGPDGGKSSHPQ
jgi:hypothetical protein